MSGDNIAEAYHRIAPLLNTSAKKRLAVISVTTSSARHDLTSRLSGINAGHYYTFLATGGTVYIAFNDSDAGAVDETAVATGVTECFEIADGKEQEWQIPDGFTWLIVKGSAACKLRIALSSKNPSQSVGRGDI